MRKILILVFALYVFVIFAHNYIWYKFEYILYNTNLLCSPASNKNAEKLEERGGMKITMGTDYVILIINS